jgi:kinesin family member 14
MSFTPSSASTKRVHFKRDVSKWSLGSPAPTTQRLSTATTIPSSSVENIENINSTSSHLINSNKKLNANHPSTQCSNENNLITVGIRVRPLNAKEKSSGSYNVLKLNEENNEITLTDRLSKLHKFSCDFVITNQQVNNTSTHATETNKIETDVCLEDSQQLYVYEKIGKPLLNKAYDGYNVSIFAYGQTGSGKTYSMIGTNDQPGLIPRFFEDLFERKAQRDQIGYSTHVEISYYEIYNEKIYDLLRSGDVKEKTNNTNSNNNNNASSNQQHALNGRNLQIRENPQTGPYIVDLLTLSANSAADAKLW